MDVPSSACLILVAGPSGSGKSRLTRQSGLTQLRLDDFYLDQDHPDLPRAHGIVDWDDPRSWDCDAAVRAITALLDEGSVEVPEYNISLSRAVGRHLVALNGSRAVVCEGVFAPELLAPARAAGLEVLPIWLDRSPLANFSRRLRRDLKQHRKSPPVLVRRGLSLLGQERGLRRAALGRGFEPYSMDAALDRLRTLAHHSDAH